MLRSTLTTAMVLLAMAVIPGSVADQDCHLSVWSKWGPCEGDYPNGIKTRSRQIVQRQQGNGEACAEMEQTKLCKYDCESTGYKYADNNVQRCDWKKSVTKVLSVTQEPANGGKECPARSYVENCPDVQCEVVWNTFYKTNNDSESSVTADTKKGCADFNTPELWHSPMLKIVPSGKYVDAGCDAGVTRENPTGPRGDPKSNSIKCKKVACTYSWSGGITDKNCDNWQTGVVQKNLPKLDVQGQGGVKCVAPPAEMVRCTPVNCKLEEKTTWQDKCDGTRSSMTGVQKILQHSRHGGKACEVGSRSQMEIVRSNKCIIQDCVLSNWSKWEGCGGSTLYESRVRTINKQPDPIGKPCGHLEEERKCDIDKTRTGDVEHDCKARGDCGELAYVKTFAEKDYV